MAALAVGLVLAVAVAPPGAVSAMARPTVVEVAEGPPLSPPTAAGRAGAAQADGLDAALGYSYRFDPAAAAVAVTVDMTMVNQVPPTTSGNVISKRYWKSYGVVAVAESTGFAATADGRSVAVHTLPANSPRFTIVEVDFGRNLFYRDSVSLHLTYSIPSVAPRSDAITRINSAFASFPVLAVGGDPGHTSVEVIIPRQFDVELVGYDMPVERGPDVATYRVTNLPDPDDFWVDVLARDHLALATKEVKLPQGTFAVRAWPGDAAWADFVAK